MRRLSLSIALLAAMIALAVTPQARAEHGAHIVHGVIVEVNLDHSFIRLHTEHHTLRIHVHENTVITLNGEPAELADLHQGDRARVRIVRDTQHPDHFRFAPTHVRAHRL
jgi:hypothetical protein